MANRVFHVDPSVRGAALPTARISMNRNGLAYLAGHLARAAELSGSSDDTTLFLPVHAPDGTAAILQIRICDHSDALANHAWARRLEIEAPDGASDRTLLRRARAALGLTGLRGRVRAGRGDDIEWRPHGVCAVLFVTARY